jgi:hypothetical protein
VLLVASLSDVAVIELEKKLNIKFNDLILYDDIDQIYLIEKSINKKLNFSINNMNRIKTMEEINNKLDKICK